jgi:hypothetical protein
MFGRTKFHCLILQCKTPSPEQLRPAYAVSQTYVCKDVICILRILESPVYKSHALGFESWNTKSRTEGSYHICNISAGSFYTLGSQLSQFLQFMLHQSYVQNQQEDSVTMSASWLSQTFIQEAYLMRKANNPHSSCNKPVSISLNSF